MARRRGGEEGSQQGLADRACREHVAGSSGAGPGTKAEGDGVKGGRMFRFTCGTFGHYLRTADVEGIRRFGELLEGISGKGRVGDQRGKFAGGVEFGNGCYDPATSWVQREDDGGDGCVVVHLVEAGVEEWPARFRLPADVCGVLGRLIGGGEVERLVELGRALVRAAECES